MLYIQSPELQAAEMKDSVSQVLNPGGQEERANLWRPKLGLVSIYTKRLEQ